MTRPKTDFLFAKSGSSIPPEWSGDGFDTKNLSGSDGIGIGALSF
jgi:hypothetical protein